MEERLEALKEPWTSFVIEFPTYPKHMIHGREESQRILFLCPQSEANPTELCLAMFGSQILMHRHRPGEPTDALSTASFVFVYSSEIPDALRRVLDGYTQATNAPVVVARKSNIVKSAHFVKEFLSRAATMVPGHAAATDAFGGQPHERNVNSIAGDEDLWAERLPEIKIPDGNGGAVSASHSLQDYRAEYACRYVLAHFHENINRDKMAETVNLSPGYFSNLFRSEVGMSFSDYLIQVRVENAKNLLRRFDLSVDAISKKCGFNSLAHFSRTFKDRCGMSPLKYRKSPPVVN